MRKKDEETKKKKSNKRKSPTGLCEVQDHIGATGNLKSELEDNNVVGVIQLGD
jgi:hypothetical protein